MNSIYNGRAFPEYIFTDKVKSYLFVDFDMLFMDEGFWKIMKSFLESSDIAKIVIENLDPKIEFVSIVEVAKLPKDFIKLVQTENIEGYFSFNASFHMITIKTLIYSEGDEAAFCILADRDYSIGIVGFSSPNKPDVFAEYEIINVPEYLRLTFAGKELPSEFKHKVIGNWELPPLQL